MNSFTNNSNTNKQGNINSHALNRYVAAEAHCAQLRDQLAAAKAAHRDLPSAKTRSNKALAQQSWGMISDIRRQLHAAENEAANALAACAIGCSANMRDYYELRLLIDEAERSSRR